MRAMMVAMEDHRSSKFPELTMSLFQQLKKVFKTETGQPFIFSGSGTGAWEAALTNTLSPGNKVLAPRFGQFSHLWIDLAQRVGLDVVVQDEEWGTGASPERIEEALRADRAHTIKGVLIVHNETATGVTSDVAAIRRAIDAAAHPAMLYVDGVSSIASIDFRMDDLARRSGCHRISERADASSRPRHRLRQRESASRQQKRALRADILRLRRPDESKRHRLFSLYAFVAHALWTEGVPQHPVRGAAHPRI
jgi:hypothetical protein